MVVEISGGNIHFWCFMFNVGFNINKKVIAIDCSIPNINILLINNSVFAPGLIERKSH